MEETLFSDSSTSAAQKRVKSALAFSLKNKYGIEDESITRKILKIHGLDVDNFDVVANTERAITEKNLKDESVDQNSNKSGLTIAGLVNETITVPYSKLIGYRTLYREMKALYGKSEAKRLSAEMYDFSIALNDSSKILQPYCYSYDFSKLVLEGRPWGQLKSKPPKRVSSYISALVEFIHGISNQQAGACAVGSFFEDIAYIILYRENKKLFDIKHSKKMRKEIENSYQSFVHSINHLSRNATESPFTNISIFDRKKLEGLISNENMGWYFNTIPKWFFGSKQKWFNYVIDAIMELQYIFMDFFEKGDPTMGGMPYRFPVTTLNISKNEATGELLDQKFIDNVCNREIFRYNIMVSKGSKTANCCRLLSDSDMLELGGSVSSLGMSQISLGSHRVAVMNFNRMALEARTEEEFFDIVKARAKSSAEILKAHKSLLANLEKDGYQQFISNGYMRMDRLYSTYGMIGLVEGAVNLARKFGKNEEYFMSETLKLVNDLAKENSKKFGIIINIEAIPGESMAVRLHDADAILFGESVSEAPLYSNQFLSLWSEESIWKRFEVDGKFSKLLTGGGITMFNISDRPTKSQIKKLIVYSAKSGCEHFSLNSVYSECENHHTSFGNFEACPVCGDKIINKFTRIVGYFSSISEWTKIRKEWEFPRRYFSKIGEKE